MMKMKKPWQRKKGSNVWLCCCLSVIMYNCRIPPATSHQGPRKKKHSHKRSHQADSRPNQTSASSSSNSYTSDPNLQRYFPSAIDQQGRTQLTIQAIPQPPYYLPPPQQLGNTPSSSFPSNPAGIYHMGQAPPSPHHYPLAASQGLSQPPQSGTTHSMLSTIPESNPNTNSFV